MKWDVIKELEYSEAMELFNEHDFETVITWREGTYRGTTDYTISMYDGGYLLTIEEIETERYYIIKNIII
jgi:hypothetical protein